MIRWGPGNSAACHSPPADAAELPALFAPKLLLSSLRWNETEAAAGDGIGPGPASSEGGKELCCLQPGPGPRKGRQPRVVAHQVRGKPTPYTDPDDSTMRTMERDDM